MARGLGADAEEAERAGRDACDEVLELLVELEDLAVELVDAAGEAAEGELGGLQRFVDPLSVGSQLPAERGPRLSACAFGGADHGAAAGR